MVHYFVLILFKQINHINLIKIICIAVFAPTLLVGFLPSFPVVTYGSCYTQPLFDCT